MASAIPPILVEIKANVDSLKSGMDQATKAIDKVDDQVRKTDAGFNQFIGRMKQVAATVGVAFAGREMLQFARDSIAAASDLNESLTKSNVVFGENAKAIEEWSKSSATSLGMSQQQALEATGTYGNLFQALGVGRDEATKMSTTLVQLAADLASFNNASPEETLDALRSGLSGQPEALKRFGIAINEVTLKQQALNMNLIENTKGVLPPAIKAQATYALVMEQTKMAQGDFADTSDGVANKQRILTAQMEDAKAKIGAGLLPMWQTFLNVLGTGVIPMLSTMGTFLSENKEAMVVFTAVLMAGAAAWGVYELWVKRAIIQEKIMQALQKLNPIGLIVVAVAALAAAFVVAWNKSAKFRDIVIEVGKAGIKAIGWLIGIVGDLITGMMKLVSGPMRLLLQGLSLIGVSGAKSALDTVNKGIENTGKFFDSAAKKVSSYASQLDKLKNKKIDFATAKEDTPNAARLMAEAGAGVTTATGAATSASKAKATALEKLRDLQKDLRANIAEAQAKYQEATSSAYEAYAERVTAAEETLAERRAEIQTEFQDRIVSIAEERDSSLLDAQESYNSRVTDIEERYAETRTAAQERYASQIEDLEASHQQKIIDLNKQAASRLADIVRQSMDRLRDAWAKGTSFNVAEMFKALKDGGDQSGEALLQSLRNKLSAAKQLAANAAALASAGFSQTFIEQVVGAGPEQGNALAESILGSGPQTITELQQTYAALELTTNTGMDALSKTMYEKSGLATDSLKAMYEGTQVALAESLAAQTEEYTKSMTEINATLVKSMADADKERTDSLAKTKAEFDKQVTEIHAKFEKAFADAEKKRDSELAKAQKAYDDAITAANKILNDALIKAAADLNDALDKAEKAFNSKLEAMKLSAQAAAAAIAAAMAAVTGARPSGSVVPTPSTTAGVVGGLSYAPASAAQFRAAEEASMKAYESGSKVEVNITANTNATAGDIAKEAMYALQYGIPLSPAKAAYIARTL